MFRSARHCLDAAAFFLCKSPRASGMRLRCVPLLALALALPAAAATEAPLVSPAERAALGKEGLPPQAAIPFPERNIDSWRANGTKGLWIRAQRKWYYAELFMNCPDLPWAESVAFVTGGPGSFDRYSYILVRGERYPLRSLTASSEPPRAERKRSKKTPASASPEVPPAQPAPPVKPESSP